MFVPSFAAALHVRKRLSDTLNAPFFLAMLLPFHSCNHVTLTVLPSPMEITTMELLNHVMQKLKDGLYALPKITNLVWTVLLMMIRFHLMIVTNVLWSNKISVTTLIAVLHANLNTLQLTSVRLKLVLVLLIVIVH